MPPIRKKPSITGRPEGIITVTKRRQDIDRAGQADSLEITPAMIRAGIAAHYEYDRFAESPLEGKRRTWLTKRERARLNDEAMILEVLTAIFGNVSVVRSGVERVRR